MSEATQIRADAGDPGLNFVLQKGLLRDAGEGHLGTIVGRGGSGKSILALQLVTELLRIADETNKDQNRRPAAFYFTLEASPGELRNQVVQFKWGEKRYRGAWVEQGGLCSKEGLHLVSVPSPVESLRTLNQKIRQTIAGHLPKIASLAAIVIDPVGAANVGQDTETNLTQLKELADTHRTFVFLLTEQHAFDNNPALEHYSQSIIHLHHEPGNRQHRRLHVQKARGQSFRPGYHHFYLYQQAGKSSEGIRVFPTIEAQSADAHEQNQATLESNEPINPIGLFPSTGSGNQQIRPGSAVFLMGPPGTFKEKLADEFANAALKDDKGAALYLSFKTDKKSVHEPLDSSKIPEPGKVLPTTYFYDARSPLLTPEEVLFTVRTAIENSTGSVKFKRAIVWGLRRLYDFPNFREGAVQFLEALVTMLKAHQITPLLVDWPDDMRTATGVLPIVDLCQYILLTRVCYRMQESSEIKIPGLKVAEDLGKIWSAGVPDDGGPQQVTLPSNGESSDRPQQVALLRIQRTPEGVHHSLGFLYKQIPGSDNKWRNADAYTGPPFANPKFEELWAYYGRKWESDLSLQS